MDVSEEVHYCENYKNRGWGWGSGQGGGVSVDVKEKVFL